LPNLAPPDTAWRVQQRLPVLLTALLSLALPPALPAHAAQAMAQTATCASPAEITAATVALPHAAAALSDQHRLRILAIGSGTLLAQGRAAAGTAFPQRMADALRAAWPTATIDLTLEGGKGLTAADQLAKLRTAQQSGHFDLILWQTGTVEAVHKVPIDEFTATLNAGATLATDTGADLILVDQQFSRMLQAKTDITPYQQALAHVAAEHHALLFRRFDLMRQWVGSGQIDLERASPATRENVATTLHACIGNALSTLVINGVAKSS
jgi:hypothetical protein